MKLHISPPGENSGLRNRSSNDSVLFTVKIIITAPGDYDFTE